MSKENITFTEQPAQEQQIEMVSISANDLEALLDNWDNAKSKATEYFTDLMTLINALSQIGLSLGGKPESKGGVKQIIKILTSKNAFSKLSATIETKIGPILEKYGSND